VGIALAGCAPPANREELVKQVLQADPAFASVLEKYRELTKRIDTHERELALKRSTIEQKIQQLRKDLAAATASVRTKTAEVKKQMEPDRARLSLALSMAAEELKLKHTQRASLGRSITRLRKELTAPKASWTDQERSAQQAKIDQMVQDAQRVDQEISTLKAHARLLKIKLLLIKL
jgi:uncharacterized protein YdcH (DUF465 family)